MNTERQPSTEWCENIIIADADYIDKVAFDLSVNFERMIGRRIPKADTARWIDCVALDGGLREGDNRTQVIFLHAKDRTEMENFAPGDFAADLDGKAFRDNLGEFAISSYPVEEVVDAGDFLVDVLATACNHESVQRVMVVADTTDAALCDMVRRTLRDTADDKRVTVFAMQPVPGGNFRQEILGYSLMNALGIHADEIPSGE